MACGDATIVTSTDIISWWCCVPTPERHTLWFLADLYPLPTAYYPYSQITDLLTLYGADLPEARMNVMRNQWGFIDAPNVGIECTEDNPCYAIHACVYIAQVYNAKLLQQITRDPMQSTPCYMAYVMPP